MNIDGMAKLLSEVLDSQIESGRHDVIDHDRIRESLTTGPPLSVDEQISLLLSPVIRSDYKQVRDKISKDLKSRLEKNNITLELIPLAASSEEDKVIFQGNGFKVILYRKDDLGVPWIILVQLGSNYLKHLNPMTILQLVDSGGLEWLRGKPDSNGEITGVWEDPDTDILARARRFSLILQPV